MLQAVLAPSQVMPENADTVQGWDFLHGCTLDELLSSFLHTGFQATAFGRAVNEVNRMVRPDNLVPHASAVACLQMTYNWTLPCHLRMNATPAHGIPMQKAGAAAGLAPQ